MPPFRRVEDHRANPHALGFLVPPGQRTYVILRPRATRWDLLPIRIQGGERSNFCLFDREEAAVVARRAQRELELAATQRADPMVTLSDAGKSGFQVGVKAGEFYWIVCPRTPGKPYAPHVFATPTEAQSALEQLAHFLFPSFEADQEYYFNTQNFSR